MAPSFPSVFAEVTAARPAASTRAGLRHGAAGRVGETDRVILAIVGPTAVGKSALALALALRLSEVGQPAEIVNADSMLLYRGMDIGTAKPTEAERGLVRHHLIDILDVTQTATVAEFQQVARRAIADCERRGVLPILVGGSALYIRAVLDHFRFPGTDPSVRARLEAELAEVGPVSLHRRLDRLDPVAAAAVLPANGRRVVRALEVIALTGGPYEASLPPRRYTLADVRQVGLDLNRTSRDARIAARVEAMWAAGLVDEVRRLAERGLRDGRTASRALGYRQVLQALDGEISEEEARAATIRSTHRFARRQNAWFGKDERITWLAADRPDLLPAVWPLATSRHGDVKH
jgi:tRNA dimethylallyltransferase